jgi:hypothetical protein
MVTRWSACVNARRVPLDPVEVGVHAIGMIDRTIYPGAYPEGTAIRFERFDLWSEGPVDGRDVIHPPRSKPGAAGRSRGRQRRARRVE